MSMNWTKEMVDAVKGNETAHGILKNKGDIVWDLLEQAHKEGAKIEFLDCHAGWTVAEPKPMWSLNNIYRVAADWQPPKPKTLAETRREFMEAAFKRGNVVRFQQGHTVKYVRDFTFWHGNDANLVTYMTNNDQVLSWQWDGYTLTEMAPSEAEADCRRHGGNVPDKPAEPEVERCEVFRHCTSLAYQRKDDTGPNILSFAVNEPDFIGYDYGAELISLRPRRELDPVRPARYPVAVLFLKS